MNWGKMKLQKGAKSNFPNTNWCVACYFKLFGYSYVVNNENNIFFTSEPGLNPINQNTQKNSALSLQIFRFLKMLTDI
jgi:hypothetical protein